MVTTGTGINVHLNETKIKFNNETKSKKEKYILFFLMKKKVSHV